VLVLYLTAVGLKELERSKQDKQSIEMALLQTKEVKFLKITMAVVNYYELTNVCPNT